VINLIVDEGYAYDYLAILSIKNVENPSTKNDENYLKCLNCITKQVAGNHSLNEVMHNKHQEIIYSSEYMDLLKANQQVFRAIEIVRHSAGVPNVDGIDIAAKEIDGLNMKRYNCKAVLQNKFFPQSKISETKT